MSLGSAAQAAAPSNGVGVQLPNGELEVVVRRADWPLESLCGFAARRNARRSHLIVSRVLGRHLPCRPSVMRAASDDLARKLPADLPGPVLMVGLAETAVCLGQCVHESYRTRTGRDDVVFLHSTRQVADAPLLARFQEAHSHAPAHLVYNGASPELRGAMRRARSLVLVDDEASTGATFANLARALGEKLPRLEVLATAVLTDWSGGDWRASLPWAGMCCSLLEGALRFSPKPASVDDPADEPPPPVPGFGRAPFGRNFGRLGRFDKASECDLLADRIPWSGGTPLLVLGSGEFTYPPFRVAERLERGGAEVWMQSTTRSPIRPGGVIVSVRRLTDDYGSGAPHYLYNAEGWPGDVLICHETPPGSLDPSLVEAFGARILSFGSIA